MSIDKERFAQLVASGLPESYALLKDACLDIWHITHNDIIINRYLDRPYQFYNEQEARELCWIHSLVRKGNKP